MRLFWLVRYAIYSGDVRPPAGKGSKENPLSMDDLNPLVKFLRRTGP
ncbi:MAG TPA: hypothetical protein VNZ47_11905 [Candidatus Dormibacteraeota bacterium]|nr:hypothetical protein [Candidatus Dormibacteraeota bacterium]